MPVNPLIFPRSEPFLRPGNQTGCILIHGFTAMPEEMRYLGEYLHGQGYTVLGLRLAGHATHPRDLVRTKWVKWLVSVRGDIGFTQETDG
jgi:carboxylesterase